MYLRIVFSIVFILFLVPLQITAQFEYRQIDLEFLQGQTHISNTPANDDKILVLASSSNNELNLFNIDFDGSLNYSIETEIASDEDAKIKYDAFNDWIYILSNHVLYKLNLEGDILDTQDVTDLTQFLYDVHVSKNGNIFFYSDSVQTEDDFYYYLSQYLIKFEFNEVLDTIYTLEYNGASFNNHSVTNSFSSTQEGFQLYSVVRYDFFAIDNRDWLLHFDENGTLTKSRVYETKFLKNKTQYGFHSGSLSHSVEFNSGFFEYLTHSFRNDDCEFVISYSSDEGLEFCNGEGDIELSNGVGLNLCAILIG